jgi:aminopeptidase N
MYPKNSEVLKNLVNGTTHHKWQFVKYCRDEIRGLLKKENVKEIFQNIFPELSELEKFQLKRILEE